jgi:hypothetical protein
LGFGFANKILRMTSLVFVAWLVVLVTVQSTVLNVVRQDSERTGYIEKYDTASPNRVVATSDVENFQFSWPLIQMTSNTKDEETYIVSYPDSNPGAVLFHLDSNLHQIYSWDNISFSFFDLQYSNLQSTLYGIYVSSTYGRVLSNFTVDAKADSVSVNQLFTLPYMWYVNASSFHHPSCHYYALINYFPGHPESTLDQQLVVADFSKDATDVAPKVTISLITGAGGIVQFIGYSDHYNQLFFAGMSSDSTTAIVGVLNVHNGIVSKILLKTPACAVGPLVVDDKNHSLTFYVKSADGVWKLWMLKGTDANVIGEYGNQDVFAASSIGF